MPALRVSIDGVMLATVSTDGYDVMSVRAGGTRIDDGLATLDLSGGSYPETGESTYLNPRGLNPRGQVLQNHIQLPRVDSASNDREQTGNPQRAS
jgi:hypothetical protein